MDFEEMVVIPPCRACLSTDHTTKLTDVSTSQLFNVLSGVPFRNIPIMLCAKCSYLVRKYGKFRDMCQKSDMALLGLTESQQYDPQTLKLLNEKHSNINLIVTPYPVNHYDIYVIEDELKIEEVSIQKDEETPELVKEEVVEDTNEDILQDTDHSYCVPSDTGFISSDDEVLAKKEIRKRKSKKEIDYVKIVDRMLDKVKKQQPKKPKPDTLKEILAAKKAKLENKEPKPVTLKEILAAKKAKSENKEPKIDGRRKPFKNEDSSDTLFTISFLSYDEQIAEMNKRKETSNYKNSAYKCEECFKGYLDETAYNSHVFRHSDQCGLFSCEICKTRFKNQHALRKHITAHHTNKFSCKACDYVTTHRQTARLHERWHKGTKYLCPHCPEEFLKFTTYMGHLRIKHPSDFVCQLCGYSFVSEKGIELHKKLKHRNDDKEIPKDGPVCELCNVQFISEEAYGTHLQVSAKHPDEDKESKLANTSSRKPKKSNVKPREKVSQENDKKSYPSQTRKAEGPIPCEQCGIQLEDSRAYHAHFRRVHPDKNRTKYPSMRSPCMCEVCGRMFQSQALLKDHTYVHTGEKPFKCDICQKTFRMKQRLVAHRRVHSNERQNYVCHVCGKHFTTQSNRQRHAFIHTGLKPFKCELCSKSFKHASEKRAHVTYVHLKKPWPRRRRNNAWEKDTQEINKANEVYYP